SDPVADGPTIQAADVRALAAGTRPRDAFAILTELRTRHPDLPIGLLVYANLVEAHDAGRGGRDTFYRAAATAGVDSILVADAPTFEHAPFSAAALAAGIEPVLIATPNLDAAALAEVAAASRGYTYVVSRVGVTGTESAAGLDHTDLVTRLQQAGAPPAVLGFGIATPAQVKAALATGARGAISGSAVVAKIAQLAPAPSDTAPNGAAPNDAAPNDAAILADLTAFVRDMKAATRR
ncbi:MAG: tryptophan synthase subunit alpha, partial [Myxococcales bacterium]|nr:tryptophan synthase subunit alpha [Myxococcales bacterium]